MHMCHACPGVACTQHAAYSLILTTAAELPLCAQVRIERIDERSRKLQITQRPEEESRENTRLPKTGSKPDKWIAYSPTQAEETEVRNALALCAHLRFFCPGSVQQADCTQLTWTRSQVAPVAQSVGHRRNLTFCRN